MTSSRSSLRTASVRRRSYRTVGVVYVLFCAGVLAIATLTSKDEDVAPEKIPAAQVPVATIQSFPDVNDMCRISLFHNDTGRYQDGGTAPCTNLISKKMVVWTLPDRAREFAKAFRANW
jgi:hypothetical protein